MSIERMLSKLNPEQKEAATTNAPYALVLAGAGSGKTRTIIARAAYLISQKVEPELIRILTFTKRAASEIVERVKGHLGASADGLKASTFHSWCVAMVKRAPALFGIKNFTIIDQGEQIYLFKVARGKKTEVPLPTASEIQEMYSFARNKCISLESALIQKLPESIIFIDQIGEIMKVYEQAKRECNYLDFDDLLDIVAQQIANSPEVRNWVFQRHHYILVDEFQDTNPLQWKLLAPLQERVSLHCVGDDAQAIYSFRGADFRNIHDFPKNVPGAKVIKLKLNYRSTQEILDVSNWVLSKSPLNYDKKLIAHRGSGIKPQLHSFMDEHAEGRWIAQDLQQRRIQGAHWTDHIILVRSMRSGRSIEIALMAAKIPYHIIGGKHLLETKHVQDALSPLRVVANPLDEIAMMRFLTLFQGVGDKTASKAIDKISTKPSLDLVIAVLRSHPKIPSLAVEVIEAVRQHQTNVSKAVNLAVTMLEERIAIKYSRDDWAKRKNDFPQIEKLAIAHTSIAGFIHEYLLNPVHGVKVKRLENDDVVKIITIHSAKGTESKVAYVVNVSPGAFPPSRSLGKVDEVEEERRVLNVAVTRAMDELIVTRNGFRQWANESWGHGNTGTDGAYFFNDLPKGLFDEHVHATVDCVPAGNSIPFIAQSRPEIGIDLG